MQKWEYLQFNTGGASKLTAWGTDSSDVEQIYKSLMEELEDVVFPSMSESIDNAFHVNLDGLKIRDTWVTFTDASHKRFIGEIKAAAYKIVLAAGYEPLGEGEFIKRPIE